MTMRSCNAAGRSSRAAAMVTAAIGTALLAPADALRAEPCDRTKSITLLDAKDDGTLEVSVPWGEASVPLDFHQQGASSAERVSFAVTSLFRTDRVGPSGVGRVESREGFGASVTPCDGTLSDQLGCVSLPLDQQWIQLVLRLRGLEPGADYAGRLHLFAESSSRTWPVRVKTTRPGVLAVQRLPALEWMGSPCQPFARLLGTAGSRLDPCAWLGRIAPEMQRTDSLDIPIIVWDATGQGPHRRVRARVEPLAAQASTKTSLALPLQALSFCENASASCADGELALLQTSVTGSGVQIDPGGQRAFRLQVHELPPGEYRSVIRFSSDDSVTDDERSRLDLTVQVRDHWLFAVVLMLVGSWVGWFGRTYLPARGARRAMLRRIRELRQRAARLADDGSRARRRLPHESTSMAFARAQALVSHARDLVRLTLRFHALAQEIRESLDEAERRIRALESYRSARMQLQPAATSWWTAHWDLSRKTRAVLEQIDANALSDADIQAIQAELGGLVSRWSDANLMAAVREAIEQRHKLIDRELAIARPLAAGLEANALSQLANFDALVTGPELRGASLGDRDEILARVGFIWRHRKRAWLAPLLDSNAGGSFEVLLDAADTKLWADWTQIASAKTNLVHLVSTRSGRVEEFEFVEFAIEVDEEFGALIAMHPAQVLWSFRHQFRSRRDLSDRNRTIQFFHGSGRVAARASLVWNGKRVELGRPCRDLRVFRNRNHAGVMATQFGFAAIAVCFAVLTGLVANYGPTFGNFSQYIALFLWSAGVSAGGNAFFYGRGESGVAGEGLSSAPG